MSLIQVIIYSVIFLADCATIGYFLMMGNYFLEVFDSIYEFKKIKFRLIAAAMIFFMIVSLFRFEIYSPIVYLLKIIYSNFLEENNNYSYSENQFSGNYNIFD